MNALAQVALDAPENPRVVVGGNNPPQSERERLEAKLTEWLAGWNVWSERKELTEETSGRARDFEDGIKLFRKKFDDLRKAEAKVHDDAKKRVQEEYAPFISQCDQIITGISGMVDRYLKKLEAKKEEERRVAREKAEAAERERKEAEAAAARATNEAARIQATAAAEAAAKQAQAAAREVKAAAAPARVESATGLANRRSVKVTVVPKIDDIRRAVLHYIEAQELEELILKLAAADWRHAPMAGGEKQRPKIPGIIWVEQSGAAS
jgi:hypothetical protein